MGSRSESRSSSPSTNHNGRSRSKRRGISPESCGNETIRMAWREIKKDKDNFDAWMHILNLVDQLNDLPIARDIYDRFLGKYPYCYGFWKKCAEMESRNGNFRETISVWERAIVAIPLSIDLWLGFLASMRELDTVSKEGVTKMKQMYDRALTVAGLEFNSDRLWTDAIAWEEARGDWKAVSDIYDRLLKTPTALYKAHYEKYKNMVEHMNPTSFLTTQQYADYSFLPMRMIINTDELFTSQQVDESEVRCEILIKAKDLHDVTSIIVEERLPFEKKINRKYFDILPLDKNDVSNWHKYLEFEILKGDEKRVQTLFERCVIPCASYDEFWLRYAEWLCGKKRFQDVHLIYARANSQCPNSVSLALQSSTFEETQGNVATAFSILDAFKKRIPESKPIQLRWIGMNRRCHYDVRKIEQSEDILALWEELINENEESILYYTKLAKANNSLAENLIEKSMDVASVQIITSIVLNLAYMDPDFSQLLTLRVLDRSVQQERCTKAQLVLSQQRIDFLHHNAHSPDVLREHYEQHQKLLRNHEMKKERP